MCEELLTCTCMRCRAAECWREPVRYEALNDVVQLVLARQQVCVVTPRMRLALRDLWVCLGLMHAHREREIAYRVQQALEILGNGMQQGGD